MKKTKRAFTFVELIVVITIIAILSTVGFTVYESYLGAGRDANRIIQLRDIHDGLAMYATKNRLPIPNNAISVEIGSRKLFDQGNLSDAIVKLIQYNGGGKDVELKIFPTYTLSKNRKDFQLLWFLEDAESLITHDYVSQSYASKEINYSQLFPKVLGAPLGTMLDASDQTPLQFSDIPAGRNYDILSGTGNLRIYYSDREFFDTDWGNILNLIPDRSCKRLNDMGKSKGTGEYIIRPDGINAQKVYCEMDMDGGGWTLVARSVAGASGGPFGWIFSTGSVQDDTQPYSYGSGARLLDFTEIVSARYRNGKNITAATKHIASSKFLEDDYNTVTPTTDLSSAGNYYKFGSCEYIIQDPSNSSQYHCEGMHNVGVWGKFGLNDRYYMAPYGTWNGGLKINGFEFVVYDDFRGSQGMVFVR